MAAANTDKFKKAKRKFSTTVGAGGFAQGATTLPLTTTTGLDTDTAITLMLDPGGATEEVITGVVSGSDIINCVRGKEGTTDQDHSAGDAVSMYFTETHWDDAMTGILAEHAQDGSHTDITADTIEATSGTFDSLTINGSATEEGWSPLGDTPDTITNNGNRSYDLVFNSTDHTDTITPGMRLQLTRTVTAPTQCTDLELSSSQYYSKSSPSGMTFTDDFVCSAWVKLESYGAAMMIMSRYNGTSGWEFFITSAGQVVLQGKNAGAANYSNITSGHSIPLGRWVHIAAQLDMSAYTATSTTSYIMIDGVGCYGYVGRGGTNPTALVQAGNLEVGSSNGGSNPFDGKLAQVAVFSAKVTQATMQTYMSQGLAGNETSLISAYSFNNAITDLNTSNANNLTAQNSAVATATDSPFAQRDNVATGLTAGTVEYGIVTAASYSTNTTLTVQVPEGSAIPTSGGISAVSYSISRSPFGFPSSETKWDIILLTKQSLSQSAPTLGTWYNAFSSGAMQITVPIGAWRVDYNQTIYNGHAAGASDVYITLSTANNTESDNQMTCRYSTNGTSGAHGLAAKEREYNLSAATVYYLNIKAGSGGASSIYMLGDQTAGWLRAKLAYV